MPPPPRGFEGATCSSARAPRLLWGVARSLQSAYEAESAIPLYRPSDTVGAAWVTYSLDQAYIEPGQNVVNRDLFFQGKVKKNHVVIRDIFVVNRDKQKKTFHDKKITNRDFFLR